MRNIIAHPGIGLKRALMVYFGQVVAGPPSSGKSTYIIKMKHYLETLNRQIVVVNLDPANDELTYQANIDIKNFITVQDVMEINSIGPNAGLLYCYDMLLCNIKWLTNQLAQYHNDTNCSSYFLIDCPGQSELFTHSESLTKILNILCHECSLYSFTCVYMIDIQHCCDVTKYMNCVLQSLIAMMHLHLPQINAISKFDLLPKYYNDLDFKVDYYLNVLDLSYMVEKLRAQHKSSLLLEDSANFYSKICEIITDYALVTFVPLCSYDLSTLFNILVKIDQANGYVYSQKNVESLMTFK